MVKHLHFNPANFNQLILSGLLIEIYKDDIELHPSEQTHQLKFIQGQNVVEDTIEAILKFANADSRKKYFGLNRQQQAVISMINGVCKDIDAKLLSAESSDDLIEKITYLNDFWASPSSEWIKQKFYYCHMNILTLSFRLQQKFPDLLIKFLVFVELRRLFISDKWLSKRALMSMFANPCNVYQEFDLFPQAEGECSLRSSFGVPAQDAENDSEIQQVENNFVQIQTLEIPEGDEIQGRHSYHLKQKAHGKQLESQVEVAKYPTAPTPTENHANDSRISQGFRDIDSETSAIKPTKAHFNEIEEDRFQILEADSHIKDSARHTQQPTHQQVRRTSPENETLEVVKFNVIKEGSVVIEDYASDVKSYGLGNTRLNDRSRMDETINQSEINQKNLERSDNQESHTMKKSLKQSFSEQFTRPLEYSTRSLAEKEQDITHEEKIQEKREQKVIEHVKQQKHEYHTEKHQEAKKQHEHSYKQHKTQAQAPVTQTKTEQHTIQLQKQVIIDEAQSQKYVSQQHVQPIRPKTTVPQPQSVQQSQNQQSSQQQQNSKPPQSQSLASASQKGPRTDMKQSIKPKEQPVQKQKETCKCEIY